MLHSGKKICALCDKQNKYSNSCDVRKKNSERNKKPNPPPFKLNGRSLRGIKFSPFYILSIGFYNCSNSVVSFVNHFI